MGSNYFILGIFVLVAVSQIQNSHQETYEFDPKPWIKAANVNRSPQKLKFKDNDSSEEEVEAVVADVSHQVSFTKSKRDLLNSSQSKSLINPQTISRKKREGIPPHILKILTDTYNQLNNRKMNNNNNNSNINLLTNQTELNNLLQKKPFDEQPLRRSMNEDTKESSSSMFNNLPQKPLGSRHKIYESSVTKVNNNNNNDDDDNNSKVSPSNFNYSSTDTRRGILKQLSPKNIGSNMLQNYIAKLIGTYNDPSKPFGPTYSIDQSSSRRMNENQVPINNLEIESCNQTQSIDDSTIRRRTDDEDDNNDEVVIKKLPTISQTDNKLNTQPINDSKLFSIFLSKLQTKNQSKSPISNSQTLSQSKSFTKNLPDTHTFSHTKTYKENIPIQYTKSFTQLPLNSQTKSISTHKKEIVKDPEITKIPSNKGIQIHEPNENIKMILPETISPSSSLKLNENILKPNQKEDFQYDVYEPNDEQNVLLNSRKENIKDPNESIEICCTKFGNSARKQDDINTGNLMYTRKNLIGNESNVTPTKYLEELTKTTMEYISKEFTKNINGGMIKSILKFIWELIKSLLYYVEMS